MSETGIEQDCPQPSFFIDGVLWGLSIVNLVDAAFIYFGVFSWLQK